MFHHAADEAVGKLAGGQFRGAGGREVGFQAPGGGGFFLGDGRGALGIPKLVQRLVQVVVWIEVVLKKKLHGAFARLSALSMP